MKKILVLCFVLIAGQGFSQQLIDQIVAVVGDEIILESEIEAQAIQLRSQGYVGNRDVNCEVLEEMLFQKLLLLQAQVDSIEVTYAEVDGELSRRLGVFINQLGSEQKLEEYYGKSISDIKSEFREMIREQLLTQRMQQQLTVDVSLTPSEVKKFFNKIPEDSIPFLPATYQIKQIAVYPKVSEEERERCERVINEYRDRIINGDDFSTLAVLYSDDPGSSPAGGELGFVSRTDLVPEFAAAAFNLQSTDDVSRVVETEFGYHILQLIERRGNLVNVRHILVTPKTGRSSENQAKADLELVREKVLADSLSFEDAAAEYSEDEMSANSGGTMQNMQTGKIWFNEDQLDPLAKDVLKRLKPGELSKVIKTRDMRGKMVYKFFKLERKIEAHQANLKDDYQRFQETAIAEKKQKKIQSWTTETLETTYVRVDSSYVNCKFEYADWAK
ncbi:MAG: peptidylprolyl isomerase [Bacteroidota bacterium]|nr:peptidylprolyl isomerase [Bacteroidota bacterium]